MGASLTLEGKGHVAGALIGSPVPAYGRVYLRQQAGTGEVMCELITATAHGVTEVVTPYADGVGGNVTWAGGFEPVASITDVNGTPTIDVDVGATGSGATLTVTYNAGAPFDITSFRLAIPKQFGTVLINTQLQERLLATLMTGGGASPSLFPGAVTFYSGTAPADCDLAPTGTVLATWVTTESSFSNSGDALVPNFMPVSVTASATGTIGYARITSNTGNRIQFSVGVATGDMRVSTLSTTSGVAFSITSFDISAG